jgi:hypothetical protein
MGCTNGWHSAPGDGRCCRRMKVGVFACSLLALVVAGCGAIGPSSSDGESAEAAKKQTLRLTKSQAKDTATAMLVRPSDLPSGWSEADGNNRRNTKKASYLRASGADRWCRRFLTKKVPMLADEESPTFVNDLQGGFVGSAAAIFTSQKEARKAYRFFVRALRSTAGRNCVFAPLRHGSDGSSVSFGKGHVRPLAYRVGERSWGFRSSFRIHTRCGCATGYFAFLVIHERQAASWVLSGRFSRPLSKELERQIARRVAERMKLAQAARDAQA